MILILFTSLLLGLAGIVSAQETSSADAHANKATELVQAGNLKEAEAELRSAMRLAPNDPFYIASLGTVLAMQSNFEESTRIFQQALKIRPADSTVRRYLAANLWQLHRYPEARQNLEILLKQTPDDQQSRLLLGMVAENMKDYGKAAEMLASVPEQVHQQPQAIVALARSYYHLGRTAEAQSTLATLEHVSRSTDAIVLGAQIADEGHDYATAERMLSSLQASSPDRWDVAYKIALVQYHALRFEACQHTLLSLIDKHAGSELYNLLGWCYYKRSQSAEALQSLERAIELSPSDERNYLDLGEMLIADRSFPTALQLALKMTLALPNSAQAFELRALAETKTGQLRDAMDSYARALQLDSSRPEALLGLAQVQYAGGLKKEGIASFESGLKQFPKNPQFKVQYAAILLKEAETGDTRAEARAESLLRSALLGNRSLPDAHYELGNLALRKGRTTEAIRHLQEAEKLEPQSKEIHFALSRAYRRAGRTDEAAQQMDLYRKLDTGSQAGALQSDNGEPQK